MAYYNQGEVVEVFEKWGYLGSLFYFQYGNLYKVGNLNTYVQRNMEECIILKGIFVPQQNCSPCVPNNQSCSWVVHCLSVNVIFKSSEQYVKYYRSLSWVSSSRTLSIQQIQSDLFTCLNGTCWCWLLLKIWECLKQFVIMNRAEDGE